MMTSIHSPLYRKAFEHYLRKGIPIETSIKTLLKAEAEERITKLYRWRTAGDNKVRKSHAANEGKIFSWDNPPETGHPGEDFNCRCWAEPVEIEKPSPAELLLLLTGVGLIRRVGVTVLRRVGEAIIRRVDRGSTHPPIQKPENIPHHWEKLPSNKGEGARWRDPQNIHNEIRVQRGNPNNSNPSQQKDYVRWKKDGRWLDKYGRPSTDHEKTHIPVEEFTFDPKVFK